MYVQQYSVLACKMRIALCNVITHTAMKTRYKLIVTTRTLRIDANERERQRKLGEWICSKKKMYKNKEEKNYKSG